MTERLSSLETFIQIRPQTKVWSKNRLVYFIKSPTVTACQSVCYCALLSDAENGVLDCAVDRAQLQPVSEGPQRQSTNSVQCPRRDNQPFCNDTESKSATLSEFSIYSQVTHGSVWLLQVEEWRRGLADFSPLGPSFSFLF